MQGRRKGGTLGASAPPMFGRTVNPISTRGGRLCPPQYYQPPGNLIPCDGPVVDISSRINHTPIIFSWELMGALERWKIFGFQRYFSMSKISWIHLNISLKSTKLGEDTFWLFFFLKPSVFKMKVGIYLLLVACLALTLQL